MTQENKQASSVTTPIFRLAFPSIWEPTEFLKGDGKPKYRITMLFPKDSDLSDLKKVATNALKKKWPNEAPANLKNPFGDGNTQKAVGFADMTFVRATANSTANIGVYDAAIKPVIDRNEVYGGCYCRAHVRAAAYDTAGNRGVAFYFSMIQKVKDGESFETADPNEVFTSVAVDADDPNNYSEAVEAAVPVVGESPWAF